VHHNDDVYRRQLAPYESAQSIGESTHTSGLVVATVVEEIPDCVVAVAVAVATVVEMVESVLAVDVMGTPISPPPQAQHPSNASTPLTA
jgi:hypothetical protein